MGSSMRTLILKDYRSGKFTLKELADKYGYTLTSVKAVCTPKTNKITSIVISKTQPNKKKEPTLLEKYVVELNVNGAAEKAKWVRAAKKAWVTIRYNRAHGIAPKKKKKI